MHVQCQPVEREKDALTGEASRRTVEEGPPRRNQGLLYVTFAMKPERLRRQVAFLLTVDVLLRSLLQGALALDCFKCVSLGGENPACEDPFHNNYTVDILEAPCWAGRKHRDGLFPATACIKLSGVYDDSGQTMMVRGCALDSGTLTIDTEIVRMSHCGGFYFDNRYVRGCLQSCFEDACNIATSLHAQPGLFILFLSSASGFLWQT